MKIVGFVILLFIVIVILSRVSGIRLMKYAEGKNSMSPTISPGDLCLCVFKRNYSSTDIKRGMIVLFFHKNYSYLLTKRIIGLEGDLIEIDEKTTTINGQKLDEPYAVYQNSQISYGDVSSIQIPKGKAFVLGDNRSGSLDSRYSEFGLLDLDQIKGKPLFIIWSAKTGKKLKKLR